jgi:flavodoxin I
MVKKYATMASVFALGVVLGMICLSTMESEGLNGSSVLKTIAPSKGHSKARYSAGCYGDSSLCAALLTAHNGKEFQRLLSSMSMPAGRKLFATGLGAPKVGTKPLLAKSARAQGSRNVALQMSVGLYYSTTTGNTETVAGYIGAALGIEAEDIGSAEDEAILAHDAIVVGAPTWHTGADEQRSGTSWDEWLYDQLPNLDFTGKKVAIFGVGDSGSYSDNFCDATGELYECFTKQGAEIIGGTSADDGFDYTESKGVVDGKFVGQVFDEDNYYDASEERANAWVEQLKGEGLPA